MAPRKKGDPPWRRKIGPTGSPPMSKDASDKGGINAALIREPDGMIKVEFGCSLSFLRMTKIEALAFAKGLIDMATDGDNN